MVEPFARGAVCRCCRVLEARAVVPEAEGVPVFCVQVGAVLEGCGGDVEEVEVVGERGRGGGVAEEDYYEGEEGGEGEEGRDEGGEATHCSEGWEVVVVSLVGERIDGVRVGILAKGRGAYMDRNGYEFEVAKEGEQIEVEDVHLKLMSSSPFTSRSEEKAEEDSKNT